MVELDLEARLLLAGLRESDLPGDLPVFVVFFLLETPDFLRAIIDDYPVARLMPSFDWIIAQMVEQSPWSPKLFVPLQVEVQ